MLRKQAATYGVQWDQYMYEVLWAYHNTQHPTDMSDYQEEMVTAISTARALVNQKAQRCYKQHYKKTATPKLKVGDWALVYFPKDEKGRMRKLSQLWYGL